MSKIRNLNRVPIIRLPIIALTTLMVFCFLSPLTTYAAEDISLLNDDSLVGSPFNVSNMLPGDSLSKEYLVNVLHEKVVTVHYRSDIRSGHEILAEVLKVRIELVDKNETLYNGLMKNMPTSLKYQLQTGEDSLRYRVTAYLDTSVGEINEVDPDGKRYMNQELVADFRWWYLEESESEHPSPAVAKLTAEKILNGKHPKGKDFTFILSDSQRTPIQYKNNNGGKIEFETLVFSDPGVYTFYLTEQNDAKRHITYDDSVYTISIKVSEESGALVASRSYFKDGTQYFGEPRFSNSSTLPQTGDSAKFGLYLAIIGGTSLLLLIALKKRRKEGSQYE